jgi:hypothetical protein
LESRYYASDGHERARRGDLEGAIRAFHGAIAADREGDELYLHLGYAYERLGERSTRDHPAREEALRRAVVCHRRVASHVPGLRRHALVRLAALHGPAGLDEPGLLESDLELLVGMGPSTSDWTLALARLREDAGRLREAETTLLATEPPGAVDPLVTRELARFYRRHERLEASLAVLERGLAGRPDDQAVLLALVEGTFYRAFRDHRLSPGYRITLVRRGLQASQRLLRADPENLAARRYRTLLLRLEAEHTSKDG